MPSFKCVPYDRFADDALYSISEPGDGPIYDRFADDALYSIHITNPTSGQTVIRYDFEFSDVNPVTPPGLKFPFTILSYGRGGLTNIGPINGLNDPTRNYTQTYTVKKNGVPIGTGTTTPPNIGLRTTPGYNNQDPNSPAFGNARSGARTFAELDIYTQQAIASLTTGEKVFAGSREDGFYADTGGIRHQAAPAFDLLDARILDNDGDPNDGRGQDGNGVDGFRGYNVLSYAMQVPINDLNAVPGFPTVGVYASVSRPRLTLRRTNGEPINLGPFVQMNRMGNPLFNEAFVALQDKDKYNRTSPTDDATNFANYAQNPELARLINTVFGTSFPETGRNDLASIYIPDVLRVNTSTGAVPLVGQPNFNRLSAFGGDTTAGLPSGFPNGRRLGDDVVDIALTALAEGTLFGDNVNGNDQVFHQVFPYSATPHAGPQNTNRVVGGRAVELEFVTGSLPATSRVCLEDVTSAADGCIAVGSECVDPVTMAPLPHLHRTIGVQGQAGTFLDPDFAGCGHGVVFLNAFCGKDSIPNCGP